MDLWGRGQVGVEAILAVAIVALLFLAAAFIYTQNMDYVEFAQNRFAQMNACNVVSSAIGSAYANPDVDANFDIDRDVNVSSGQVIIGTYYCDYSGKAQDVLLELGAVNVKRVGDEVVLQNV